MTDTDLMRAALRQAAMAEQADEVPVGAVVAVGGEIVAEAANRTIRDRDPSAHAEIVALRSAGQRIGNHRLVGATLYVTLEPCIMCAGAVVQARLARVVFGCRDPKAGALGSVYDIAGDAKLNHVFAVDAGVEEAECRLVLQRFFQKKRQSGGC